MSKLVTVLYITVPPGFCSLETVIQLNHAFQLQFQLFSSTKQLQLNLQRCYSLLLFSGQQTQSQLSILYYKSRSKAALLLLFTPLYFLLLCCVVFWITTFSLQDDSTSSLQLCAPINVCIYSQQCNQLVFNFRSF